MPPTPVPVAWTSTGAAITEVKLEYTSNGTDWVTIKSNVDNTGGKTYDWAVTSPGPLPMNLASNNMKIRISASNPPQPIALYPEVMSSVFTLCGDLTVTSPTDATTWIADGSANKTISWDVYGKVDNVKIDYTRGGTGSWSTIVTSTGAEAGDADVNQGSYNWTLPTDPSDPPGSANGDYITRFNTNGKSSMIRIYDADTNFDDFVQDDSQGFLVKGRLTITQPASVASGLDCGSLQTIEWQRDGRINAVNVKYSINGGSTYPNTIQGDRTFENDSATTQTTSSQWSVPETPMVTTYRLLVEDTEYEKDGTAGTFIETANFRVNGELALTAPVDTTIWRILEQKTISWNVLHGNMGKVKIMASPLGDFSDAYSIASAGTIDAFSAGDPFDVGKLPAKVGSGSYLWTIPVTTDLVDTMKFKIVQEDAGFTDIESNNQSAAIEIRPSITVQTRDRTGPRGLLISR